MVVTEKEILSYRILNNDHKFYFKLDKKYIITTAIIAAVIALIVSVVYKWGFVYVIGSLFYVGPLAAFAFILYGFQIFSWTTRVRLHTFAQVNGFTIQDSISYPAYKGLIFDIGSNRMASNVITCTKPRPFQIGNYSYVIGSDDNKTTFSYGFVAIQLDRNLPHMVLDSKKNDTKTFGISFSNLPVSFDKDQVLSLEGDFNNYFTLYAPEKYKSDALYIFSPDLMALFIDESMSFDAEIIDNELFIYSKDTFNVFDTTLLQKLFAIVDSVGSKTIHQTSRYVDEKVDSKLVNEVSGLGMRLKRHMSVSSIIGIVFGIIVTVVIAIKLMSMLMENGVIGL